MKNTDTPIKTAFTTWTFNGVRFLATDDGRNAHVLDESGNYYGSWMSGIDGFRKRQTGGDPLVAEPLGKASVSFLHHRQ